MSAALATFCAIVGSAALIAGFCVTIAATDAYGRTARNMWIVVGGLVVLGAALFAVTVGLNS